MSFFEELRRRNVFRVASAYAVFGWVLAQVAEFAFETFGAPDWALKSLVILLLLGLPLAVFFAWAFELTPGGIRREADVDHSRPAAARTGRKLDRAIIVVLLIALAWFAWDRFSAVTDDGPVATTAVEAGETVERGNGQAPSAGEKSVAVLPFVAMSSGPDDGYFADGLTEEILNSLAGLPELLVTARTSVFSFKGRDMPVQEIAAVLQVQHVVEGSVRRSGDRLRVTAQLIRAEDGFHLWSETYDRDAGDTFGIQTDIAEKIATALDVVLDDERRAQMALANIRKPEAFIAFQKGRELFARAHEDLPQLPTLKKANAYFDQAIELEPDFFHAYIARNDFHVHTLINNARLGPPAADLEQDGIDAARRALETNFEAAVRSAPGPTHRLNVEYDQALLLGNWRGLDGLTAAVLKQKDACSGPDWIHLTAVPFGRAATALDYFENLIACDPLGADFQRHRVAAAAWSGEFDEIVRVAGAYDESGQRQDVSAYILALIAAGRTDEAQTIAETEIRDAGLAAFFQHLVAVKRGETGDAFEMASLSNVAGDDHIILAARSGDRDTVNAAAAFIDSRPFGYIPLLQIIYFCYCGAPFDLGATPTLAAMLEASGLPWPPPETIDWPLKNW